MDRSVSSPRTWSVVGVHRPGVRGGGTSPGGGGGGAVALPYMSYIGMCRYEGYGFQPV